MSLHNRNEENTADLRLGVTSGDLFGNRKKRRISSIRFLKGNEN